MALSRGNLALSPIWIKTVLPQHWASPIGRLTQLLGAAEWDSEHQILRVGRTKLDKLAPGDLFGIEIGLRKLTSPTLYREFVHSITATGATFSGRKVPLTIKGLKRTIRAAARVSTWVASAHVTLPGELWRDLGLPESDIDRFDSPSQ